MRGFTLLLVLEVSLPMSCTHLTKPHLCKSEKVDADEQYHRMWATDREAASFRLPLPNSK